MHLATQHEEPLLVDPILGQCTKSLHGCWEQGLREVQVPTQHRLGVDFVDVLPTWTAGSGKGSLQFRGGHRQMGGDD